MAIVTIPDGVTGPALQTTQIINAKWDNAQAWFSQAFDLGNRVQATVGTAPQILAPGRREPIELVPPPGELAFDDPDEAAALFGAKNAELSAIVDRAFSKMIEIAFPDRVLFADALTWCSRAINEGGTGINHAVEAALWERGRARILKQADRDMASTQEKYARAGWPLPPGAMFHDVAMIRQDSRDKLAEQNRDIAIKSFEAELENVRFAITTTGDLFTKAMQAASDYVRTVMLAPQTALQLVSALSGMKSDAARTLVSLYQAQNAALEPLIRMDIADAELKARAAEANLRAQTETAQVRVQTALASLKMVGDAAAASLNGIGAGVSNNMTSSVSL